MIPYVTVLMSVYNGEEYLEEAIASILNQTFRDFEFLIIDDSSTDGTAVILASYSRSDSRVIVVTNESNIGLPRSLNKGLALAHGKYIARMDADDISLPERLEKQVQCMDNNPEIGVCGSWFKKIGNVKLSKCTTLPEKHDDIFAAMLFGNHIGHPTVIIRKKTIIGLGQFYNEEFRFAEDYEYWARLAIVGVKFANIGEVLLNYRIHEKQVTKIHKQAKNRYADKIRIMLLRELGFANAKHTLIIHNLLRQGTPTGKESVGKIATWIDEITNVNRIKKVFSETALLQELARQWFGLCYRSCKNGLWIWNMYHSHPLSKSITLSAEQKTKFLVKCLLGINSRYDLKRKLIIR